MAGAINNTTVKMTNRGRVFKALVLNPGISRVDLARELGLTKMTISNIILEMTEKGLVAEQEKIILGEPHKNPVRLDLTENCPRIIGVQIQRDSCKAVLCDFRLSILDSAEEKMEHVSRKNLERVLVSVIERLIGQGNIIGIGVGSIGPVDIQNGMIMNPPNFGGVENFSVVDFLREKFQLPVILEHHYNCAALAEMYFGVGRNRDNFIYLGITKGVSMAGIVDGKLYSTLLHNVTEIGHMSIKYNGRQCRCGSRGCLERYVSSDVIEEDLRRITGKSDTFREFCERTGDVQIMDYLYRVMDYLKVALVGCVNIFRPQWIFIGDKGKYFPDECIEYLEKEVNRLILYHKRWHVSIQKAGGNKDLMLASPAMGIIERVFEGELLFD